MRIDLVSEHASPLAAIGGVDAGGQNVHVAALAAGLARRGHEVTVHTRRDDDALPERVVTADGYDVAHVPAGPPRELPKDELLPHMAEFARVLREQWTAAPPDVVHAHFWMSGLAAVEAAADLPTPVLQTFHALGSVKRRHQGAADPSPASRIDLERGLCRAVDHVVATCSDEVFELRRLGLPHDRAAAGHGLQGGDAERLVPGDGEDDVGRAHPRRDVGPRDGPGEDQPVADPCLRGDRAQPAHLRVRVHGVSRWTADDDEFGLGNRTEGPYRVVMALALDQPAEHEQPGTPGARRHRAARREDGGVDAARHDRDPVAAQPQSAQLEHLVRAGGDDVGHVAAEPAL